MPRSEMQMERLMGVQSYMIAKTSPTAALILQEIKDSKKSPVDDDVEVLPAVPQTNRKGKCQITSSAHSRSKRVTQSRSSLTISSDHGTTSSHARSASTLPVKLEDSPSPFPHPRTQLDEGSNEADSPPSTPRSLVTAEGRIMALLKAELRTLSKRTNQLEVANFER